MSLSYITHKGKEILLADFTQCQSNDEMISLADELLTEINNSDPAKEMRVLTNYEGVFMGTDFMKKVKQNGKLVQRPILKSATIGIDGLKKILINAYNKVTGRDIVICSSKADALEYLSG